LQGIQAQSMLKTSKELRKQLLFCIGKPQRLG
jgi:hypothetical protein